MTPDSEQYYCPMLCEGDKTYSQPGDCPVCGMHLVKKQKDGAKPAAHAHKLSPMPAIKKGTPGQYYCPMLCEGDKKYDKPGNCPVCGMHLVKEQKLELKAKEYTCPMHPEVVRSEPGSCPVCGMDLVPRVVQKEDKEEEAAYRSMRKRFWISVAFTTPIFLIAMGEMVGLHFLHEINKTLLGWIQFALSTPVVFYCSGDFFTRGYQSV